MKTGCTLQKIFSRTVALSLPLAAVLSSQSAKADYLWTGGESADWTAGWNSGDGWYCLKNLTVAPTVSFSSEIDVSADSGVLVEGTANYPVVFSATSPNGLKSKILGIGTGTYGEATLNGGTATTKYFVAGNKLNANATATNAGGSLIVIDWMRIAENNSATGKFIQSAGDTSVAGYLCVGSQLDGAKSGYNALFQLDGGTVTNTGTAMIIGARGDSAAQAKAVVNCGELVAKQIWVAEYSSGSNELEINNGLVVVSGDFYIARESGSNGKLTLNGGALQTTGIKTVAAAAIDFNGGTITDAGSGSHTLVTAATPSGENVWFGGNKGYWNDAANWSYGVPGTELSAVFRNDAVVSFNGLTTVPTLGSLKIETDNVTLTRDDASADKFHLTEFGGYGTLTLNNLGCTQVDGSTLVVTNDIVFTGTSWLGDYDFFLVY